MIAALANPTPSGVAVAAPPMALVPAGIPQRPLDHVSIVSPFASSMTSSYIASTSMPAPQPVINEESHTTLKLSQRIALAGLGGLALFGALGLGGCSAPLNHTAEMSQSQTVAAPQGETRLGYQQNIVPQQQQAPGRHRILGEDVGATDNVAGVEWKQYQGTYKGSGYEIDYPKGWKVAKTFYGIAVYNPAKTEEFVSFQWREDQGQMSPQGLLSNVLREAEATNVRINSQRGEQPKQTPNGALYAMSADVSYVADGVPVRGNFVTAVVANNGYVPFWIGNVVATQTTQADYAKDLPVLQHISNSMHGT